ncbi:5'-tyrosyl-DNA phosphodiesterase [Aureococcus anophagefferens]|nr:5'-tyrosyl-DNA phosphodiesterase [Aureococcus anophagefferens]
MIDLTGDDSNDEAPPPSLVEQLISFTGASEADAAAALADAQGSLEGAAAALLTRNSGAAPPPPATDEDLSAIRKLRDEQRRDDAARWRRRRPAGSAVPRPPERRPHGQLPRDRGRVRNRAAAADDHRRPDGGDPEAARGAVQRAAAAAPAGALTVLSFNVWFEREETFGARMAAIAALAADATVVGLQEVTDDSFPHLQRELGRRGFGTLFRQTSIAPYYCCLASKSTLVGVETVPFPGSRMGRGLLVARAAWPGVGDVLFGVAHLESFVGREVDAAVRAERRAQVARAAATLEAKAAAHGCAAAVLLGDFNWDDGKDGDAFAAAGAAWRDAWRDRGSPKASEFTYDGRANGMLKHGFKHRFDRVFVLDREVKRQTLDAADACAVATTGFRLVGTAQVGTRTIQHEKKGTLPMFPSDHFGVEPRKKAAPAAAAATGRYRGAKIPAGWDLRHGCLLVRRWGDAPPHTERLLGFDFDDTLVPLNYARPEPSQWSHLYGHAPGHLRSLDATTGLAVLSNECLDRLKKVEVLENKLRQKCGRLDNWARDVAVPVLCCVALTKLDDDARRFHKAKGAGMWDFALDELGVADKAACNARSCDVGDSDADANLARVAGVRYHHVKDYFGAMFPRP